MEVFAIMAIQLKMKILTMIMMMNKNPAKDRNSPGHDDHSDDDIDANDAGDDIDAGDNIGDDDHIDDHGDNDDTDDIGDDEMFG